ncbi:MAG TPA: hypothetical protein VFR06_00070 [Gallionellaceae bacterium]|nr:hypothetical protein [Gallionellaceae bacterium]
MYESTVIVEYADNLNDTPISIPRDSALERMFVRRWETLADGHHGLGRGGWHGKPVRPGRAGCQPHRHAQCRDLPHSVRASMAS